MLDQLAQALRAEINAIPKTMRQDEAVRQAVICLLYQAVKEMGLTPVPAWRPPKSTRDRVDLVGVAPGAEGIPEVKVAFAVDALVELSKVKSLEWVQCEQKVVVTLSPREDKVKQSTFFLTKELTHLHVGA